MYTKRYMNNLEFCDYLERLADDFDESGANSTADDYREAATRIQDLIDEVFDLGDSVLKVRRRMK